jgi:hypothetical protein
VSRSVSSEILETLLSVANSLNTEMKPVSTSELMKDGCSASDFRNSMFVDNAAISY